MEKLRFEFVMKAAADKKSNALMVTSITTPDGEIFDIPAELQEVSLHTELMKTDIYKKIKNTNLKRNQKRNVWILLNAELKAANTILFVTFAMPTRGVYIDNYSRTYRFIFIIITGHACAAASRHTHTYTYIQCLSRAAILLDDVIQLTEQKTLRELPSLRAASCLMCDSRRLFSSVDERESDRGSAAYLPTRLQTYYTHAEVHKKMPRVAPAFVANQPTTISLSKSCTLKELHQEMHKHYKDQEIDWMLVHNSGCTIDDTELPHHVTSRPDLERFIEGAFRAFLLALPALPTIVTVARTQRHGRRVSLVSGIARRAPQQAVRIREPFFAYYYTIALFLLYVSMRQFPRMSNNERRAEINRIILSGTRISARLI
ncbi:unnamed protein product, partial [Trichogramma brassicae]